MEGLRERNSNITRSLRRAEKQRTVAVPSHASSHMRTPSRIIEDAPPTQSKPKVGLDEEEMLFLARRCLAEEMMSRPNVPAVLSEFSASPNMQRQPSSQPLELHPPNVTHQPSPPSETTQPQPITVQVQPPPTVPAPVILTAPLRLHAVPPRNRLFQLHRLGVGLVILKFGWVWVSCGGLMVADSVLCTSDICMLIYGRVREHVFKIGSRLSTATYETVKLFKDDDIE